MITNLVHAGTPEWDAFLKLVRARHTAPGQDARTQARATWQDVANRGYEAVLEASQHSARELDAQELEDAVDRVEPSLLRSLEHAAKNIYEYQTKLLPESRNWESPVPGGVVGQLVRGMHRVAIYVPSADAGCASSVLMNAIPARVAGVEEIILVTPPAETYSDAFLAAAWVAGVDRVFAMGGAAAVAALALGADPVPKVEKLVGRGDESFTAAKALAAEYISIDSFDGPSDLCVIADEAANPVWAAADMLSQAERSEQSSAVLITPSQALADAVLEELERQSGALRRKAVMRQSLEKNGAVVLCGDIYETVDLANRIAPAHLEILTAAPMALLDRIQNAGCIYLGAHSPEALGEYAAGPCCDLPTLGRACYGSPITVDDYLKKTSLIKFSDEALEKLSNDIIQLSRAEELTAHANAIKVRLGK